MVKLAYPKAGLPKRFPPSLVFFFFVRYVHLAVTYDFFVRFSYNPRFMDDAKENK